MRRLSPAENFGLSAGFGRFKIFFLSQDKIEWWTGVKHGFYNKFYPSKERMYVVFISTSFDPGEFLISENILTAHVEVYYLKNNRERCVQ